MAIKQGGLMLLLTFGCLVACGITTRDLVRKPKEDLSARLQMNGDLVDCWSSQLGLRSCSNEIMLFFINGVANIGPDCCRAIAVITHNCWPAVLTSLGFTAEEGNVLLGYSDVAAAATPALAPHGAAN